MYVCAVYVFGIYRMQTNRLLRNLLIIPVLSSDSSFNQLCKLHLITPEHIKCGEQDPMDMHYMENM